MRFSIHPNRSTLRCAFALALGLAASMPAMPQGQDATKVLNLFQSLIPQPAAPAKPVSPGKAAPTLPPNAPTNPANLIGNMLGVPGAAAANPSGANQAGDLLNLLTQSVEQIDQPKEIEIGRQLAAVLLGSKPLHPDLNLQRYVNQLGRWIALQSPRPDLPWSFAVLDDTGYNAFAVPGGYVFLTKGLIDRVADESELAGILAHEITHVAERHHLKAIRKTARAGMLTQLLATQMSKDVGAGLSAQLLALGRDIYSKGLDQEDEFDADRTGVALAARAGFDPYGLVAVLQQLRGVTPDNAAFTLTLSTHPPAQARLDQIELAMSNRLDALSGRPAITLAQRMDMLALADRPVPVATPAPAPSNTRAAPVKKKK